MCEQLYNPTWSLLGCPRPNELTTLYGKQQLPSVKLRHVLLAACGVSKMDIAPGLAPEQLVSLGPEGACSLQPVVACELCSVQSSACLPASQPAQSGQRSVVHGICAVLHGCMASRMCHACCWCAVSAHSCTHHGNFVKWHASYAAGDLT